MILNRNKIAKTLGFNNYSEYSIYDLRRFDYNYKDIKTFRDNIKKYVTPIMKKISNWKKEFLGLDDLKYYDTIMFQEMPELKYTDDLLLEEIKKCFLKIDKDLGVFYGYMLENNYIDFSNLELEKDEYVTEFKAEFGNEYSGITPL